MEWADLVEALGAHIHVVVHQPPTIILAQEGRDTWRVFRVVNYFGEHRKGQTLGAGAVKALVDDPGVDVEIN